MQLDPIDHLLDVPLASPSWLHLSPMRAFLVVSRYSWWLIENAYRCDVDPTDVAIVSAFRDRAHHRLGELHRHRLCTEAG